MKALLSLALLALLYAAPVMANPTITVNVGRRPYIVDWTPWHARLAVLLQTAYNEQLREQGGWDNGRTLAHVTITENQEVSFTWVKATSLNHEKLTKCALIKIDGNKDLVFPIGTARRSYTYNLPTKFGFNAPMRADFYRDDFETVYY